MCVSVCVSGFVVASSCFFRGLVVVNQDLLNKMNYKYINDLYITCCECVPMHQTLLSNIETHLDSLHTLVEDSTEHTRAIRLTNSAE
jgi:hypothetical protein